MNKPAPIDEWTVASAKAHLSEVISRAQGSPQTITRNGKASVVIVSVEEWQQKSSRQGSLASFLMQSPLAGAELELARDKDLGRDQDFGGDHLGGDHFGGDPGL